MSKVLDRVVFDSEVSERKILRVPIHTIKPTPYNPAKRTAEGKKLQKLIKAIDQFGLSYPILITEDRDLADGNRRLAACKALGHTHIECIVSDIPRDDLFNVINDTPEPMKSQGWLEIARGGRKVPSPFKEQYQELVGLVGTYGVDMLIKNGLGMNSLGLCKSVVALDAKYLLPEVIMKVALGRLSNKVNAILRSVASREGKVIALDALLS